MKAVLYMVIPCYNEEEVLPVTSGLFLEELQLLIEKEKISEESRILFVNDGSKDRTWEIIEGLARENPHFIGICQSRNRGHQNAVLAGLMEAKDVSDITISIDCDGQDDIATMEAMVDAYYDGAEVVYGVRSSRDTDTFFKRFTAQAFYKVLMRMGVETVYNHADYRLAKMVNLAIDGITSLSVKPLRLISGLGIGVSVLSFVGVLWAVITQICGRTVTGWASTVCVICFMGGVQLVCLGVLGEYIGKIYMEVKARPRYIISERTWTKQNEDEEKGE